MAKGIVVSDDYSWSASFGLFEFVLGFLLDSIDDVATKNELRAVLAHNLPGIDLRGMSEVGRREILQVLRERLVPMAETSPKLHQPAPTRRFTIGHIKTLKLMADDVVTSSGEAGVS